MLEREGGQFLERENGLAWKQVGNLQAETEAKGEGEQMSVKVKGCG
jgi:hypothetical protein